MPKGMVKLISSDGFEFVVDYEAACVSNAIKNMLNSGGCFTESERGEVTFKEISGVALEQVCKYFYYNLQHQNSSARSIPEFKVEPAIALELLMAANFLDA